jgi:hypothetical protein
MRSKACRLILRLPFIPDNRAQKQGYAQADNAVSRTDYHMPRLLFMIFFFYL